MGGRRQLLLLLIIMLVVALSVAAIAIYSLYKASFEQQRQRLMDLARSQARTIEAIARFDAEYGADYPDGAFAATLRQIRDAQSQFKGLGETGQFLLGCREDNRIVYLLQHRLEVNYPLSIPFDAEFAKPMRRALSGGSGTVLCRGYRGEVTLAAYEPVAVYDLGIVAKIDLSEIRAPFIKSALMAAGAGFVLISIGTLLFFRAGNPIIRRIEESEKKYRSMFESSVDKLFLLASDGVVLDANLAAYSTYGFSREEFIGRNIREIVHPEQLEAHNKAYRLVAEGGTFRRESVHLKRDGTAFPVEVQLSPIIHEGSSAILASVRDISARKQAEQALRESEQRFRELAENIEEVFWVGVPGWNEVLYISPAYEKVWGRARKSLYEQPYSWVNAIVDEDRAQVTARLQQMTSGNFAKIIVGEYRITRPDGSIRWILDRAFPVRDEQGEVCRIVGVAEDITQRKLAEQALRESETRYRKLSESLEEMVRQKVAELQQAERLAAIGRLVSVVAHEIRNPLQNINMGVDALKTKIGAEEDTEEILQEIDYGINLLNLTVKELLDYARPLQLQYSLTSVGELIRNAVKMVGPQPQNITIRVELAEEERQVIIDVPKMIRVFVNVISNATEAMPDGGIIWIRSEMREERGVESLKLSVSDNGPGMDEGLLQRIFEPFFTTKARGAGLGMAICKKIVDAHKGAISVKSKPGEGTTVDISLPVHKTV